MGLELMEQLPGVQSVVVPVGGGGLIAGVATAIKGVNPAVEVVGAQAESYAAAKAFMDGDDGPVAGGATLAEGIAVRAPDAGNLEVIARLVDRVESAGEAAIERAIFDLLSAEKLVAEGAAGAGRRRHRTNPKTFCGKQTASSCAGEHRLRLLSTLILRGMVREGRIARLTFAIDDTPGQLAGISRLLAEAGANVIEVIHQRMMQAVPLKQAELDIVIEARDRDHVREIVAALQVSRFKVRVEEGV